MDTLSALTIELNAELDEVRRDVRKLTCERRTEEIPEAMGLLRAILWGIWKEQLLSYEWTGFKLTVDTLEELERLRSHRDRIIERTYKVLRKTLRLSQYLNERPV